MRKLYLLGLAAFAVMAIGAVEANSAAAAIETLWCMERGDEAGKYLTAGDCEALINEMAGKWEWEAGPLAGEAATVDFTSGTGTLRSAAGTITCTADSGTAQVLGTNALSDILITFTGCKDQLGDNCETSGQANGTILTNEAEGEFVYLKASKMLPLGALVKPNNAEEDFASFECLAIFPVAVLVTGTVIGEVLPESVNKEVLAVHIVFEHAAGNELEQEFTKVEETATKFELLANGGQASEETLEEMELLVGGVALTFEVMA